MKTNLTLILLFMGSLLSMACSENDDYEYDYLPSPQQSPSICQASPDSTETYLFTCVNWYAGNSYTNQSAATYGDYLVLIPNYRSAIHLYNLSTKTPLYSLFMESGTGVSITGGNLYHCNQATFGADFYLPDDPFPLLYISQRAGVDKRCFMEVYRLTPLKLPDDEDYTTMEAELVQTIYFPALTYDNSLGNVNCAIDNKARLMYTYSRNNNSGEDNTGDCKISSFNIPHIYDKSVMLEDSDILDSWMLGCKAINMQGGCIKDDYLFIGQGFQSAGYIYLNVVDLKRRKLVERIDLLERGITWEPEGCFIYNGNLMIASGSNIWEFVMPKTTNIRVPRMD